MTKLHRNAPVQLRLIDPGRGPPRMWPGGAWLYHRRCHAPVTNYADPSELRCLDLLLRTHDGLTWTPEDGLYNLCHEVPREGPKTRIGASSGPSKRYCRVSVVVLLTRSRSHISHFLTGGGRDTRQTSPCIRCRTKVLHVRLRMPALRDLDVGVTRPQRKEMITGPGRPRTAPTWTGTG
jgi:hypothetical protein